MSATGTLHLSHTRLGGPAERTVIEPWLTELTHLTTNAYPDEPAAALAVIESLPASMPRLVADRRIVLAEAA